jgi:hypothetical protein
MPVYADSGTATTTLTIDPSATSGTTITAADENDRGNDTSTYANAHVHRLSNTTNFGDAAAGNKHLCADAADTTDACIRWDDTANLWLVDNPTPGTFNQVATLSGTAGLTTGQVVLGNGTGSLQATTGGSSGQVLTHQGAGVTPIWGASTDTFVGAFTRDLTATSGSVAYTGTGFTPQGVIVFGGISSADGPSWGFTDCTNVGNILDNNNISAGTFDVNASNLLTTTDTSGNNQVATISSCDSNGFTLTWTKTGSPTGTGTYEYLAIR